MRRVSLDWSQLSAPQAAVLAAAIGIIAAVVGQLVGAIINVIASGVQAGKNRRLELSKLDRQLDSELARRRDEMKRAAFLEFQTAAHGLYSVIQVSRTSAAEPRDGLEAVAKLHSAMTLVALVTDNPEVSQAIDAAKAALDEELAGRHTDYPTKMERSLAAMRGDLSIHRSALQNREG